eukprot:403371423
MVPSANQSPIKERISESTATTNNNNFQIINKHSQNNKSLQDNQDQIANTASDLSTQASQQNHQQKPVKIQPKYEDENILKRNFTRFLRQVEQKKQTIQEQIRIKQQQEKEIEKIQRQMDLKTKYDLIQKEGVFEMYRKKAPPRKAINRYNEMLEQDYNENKIVVCGYIQNLLQTVEQMKKCRNLDKQVKPQIRKQKKVIKSPEKAATSQQPQQENLQNQVTRFFYNFDRDIASQMFGFRIKQVQYQVKEANSYKNFQQTLAFQNTKEFFYEQIKPYITLRKFLKIDNTEQIQKKDTKSLLVENGLVYKKLIKKINWEFNLEPIIVPQDEKKLNNNNNLNLS